MARKKNSALDVIRQGAKRGSKKTIKKISRHVAKAKHQLDLDIVAQWRALRKMGVVNTRNNPSVKKLTPAMKRKVRAAYFDLQSAGHFDKGRVYRPLVKETYTTPAGKKRTRYHLSEFYSFQKTKKKTNVKTGTIKTGKGYIFEKQSPESKFRVNNQGEVIETIGKVKWRKKAYRGEQILVLRDQIRDGRLTLPPNGLLVLRPYGSIHNERMYESDSLDFFVDEMDNYESQMAPKIFKDFIDYSEVYFIEE